MKNVNGPAAILLIFLVGGCADDSVSTTPQTIYEPPPGVRDTLRIGETLPPLQAAGWINGSPPAIGAPGQTGLVVDVTALWCPVCKTSAPSLVTMAEHYKPKGIAFVTIMGDDKMIAENYVSSQKIGWPTGYEATKRMLADLGAFQTDRPMPNADGVPTIYLVDPKGIVRWHDERNRFKHRSSAELVRKLDAAVQELLTGKP